MTLERLAYGHAGASRRRYFFCFCAVRTGQTTAQCSRFEVIVPLDYQAVHIYLLKPAKRKISPFRFKAYHVAEKGKVISARLAFRYKPDPAAGRKCELRMHNGINCHFLRNRSQRGDTARSVSPIRPRSRFQFCRRSSGLLMSHSESGSLVFCDISV